MKKSKQTVGIKKLYIVNFRSINDRFQEIYHDMKSIQKDIDFLNYYGYYAEIYNYQTFKKSIVWSNNHRHAWLLFGEKVYPHTMFIEK